MNSKLRGNDIKEAILDEVTEAKWDWLDENEVIKNILDKRKKKLSEKGEDNADVGGK